MHFAGPARSEDFLEAAAIRHATKNTRYELRVVNVAESGKHLILWAERRKPVPELLKEES